MQWLIYNVIDMLGFKHFPKDKKIDMDTCTLKVYIRICFQEIIAQLIILFLNDQWRTSLCNLGGTLNKLHD